MAQKPKNGTIFWTLKNCVEINVFGRKRLERHG